MIKVFIILACMLGVCSTLVAQTNNLAVNYSNENFSTAVDSVEKNLNLLNVPSVSYWVSRVESLASDSSELVLAKSLRGRQMVFEGNGVDLYDDSHRVIDYFRNDTSYIARTAIGHASFVVAFVLFHQAKYQLALSYFDNAISCFEYTGNVGQVFECKWNQSDLYTQTGRLADAAVCARDLLKNEYVAKNDEYRNWTYMVLLGIYRKMQNYAQTTFYTNLIESDKSKTQRTVLFQMVYRIFKAQLAADFGHTDELKKNMQEVLQLAKKQHNNYIAWRACCMLGVSNVYADCDLAEMYMIEGEDILQRSEYMYNNNLYWLALLKAECALCHNNYAEALRYLQISERKYKSKFEYDYWRHYYQTVESVYVKLNNYEAAYEASVLMEQYNDSIGRYCMEQRDLDMNTTFQQDTVLIKQQVQISKQDTLAVEKVRVVVFLIALAVVIIFLAIMRFLIVSRKDVNRKRQMLDEQKISLKNRVEECVVALRQQRDEIGKKNTNIMESINYAERIQRSILPNPDNLNLTQISGVFVFYRPLNVVSGDFYWFVKKGENLIVASADCTGHGVPGALMSMIGLTLLGDVCSDSNNISASKILSEMDLNLKKIINNTSTVSVKDQIAISIAIINLQTFKVELSAAKQIIYVFQNDKMIHVNGTKRSVGEVDYEITQRPFFNTELQLSHGDSIYMFTDGVINQFGGDKGEKLKSKRFCEILKSVHNQDVDEQQKNIQRQFFNWKGVYDQTDDALIVGVKL